MFVFHFHPHLQQLFDFTLNLTLFITHVTSNIQFYGHPIQPMYGKAECQVENVLYSTSQQFGNWEDHCFKDQS